MTPILFIHGFPFDHTMWRHQVVALSRWRCIAPDLAGAGRAMRSGSPENHSISAYAKDLIRLLDRSGVEQAVVCGLSMGGYIVFELLRRVPDRVRAAILCNTKAVADTPEGKRGRDEMVQLALERGSHAIADRLLPKVLARATLQHQRDIVHEVTEMMLRWHPTAIADALWALRDRPDSTPLLSHIEIPVLVIAGDDDQIAPAAEMRSMADAMPDARFVLVAGAGHLAPLEQPAVVSDAIRSFLLAKVG